MRSEIEAGRVRDGLSLTGLLYRLAFDVSEQIPPGSWYGTLLKGTINFSPATTWLELCVWFAYLAVVLPLFLRRVCTPRAAAAPHHTQEIPA